MTEISISSSRLWRGERSCRRAWWYRYVARAQPSNPKSYRQLAGIARHAGLEAAYRAARAAGEPPLGRSLYELAGTDALAAMESHRDGLGDQWDEITGQVLDVLAAIPAPAPLAVLAVEQKFRIVRHGVALTGVFDLVLQLGPSWIHIRDWKSSTPDERSTRLDEQLAIQEEAAREKWPWASKVTVGLYGIRKRLEHIVELDRERVREVARTVCEDAEDIADALAAAERGEAAEVFPARAGEHCTSCQYRSFCPTWTTPAPLASMFTSEKEVALAGESMNKILNGVRKTDHRQLS
jgi:CRISPR/Cas system-associated exonuclease Cas4 (RecB family)